MPATRTVRRSDIVKQFVKMLDDNHGGEDSYELHKEEIQRHAVDMFAREACIPDMDWLDGFRVAPSGHIQLWVNSLDAQEYDAVMRLASLANIVIDIKLDAEAQGQPRRIAQVA